MKGRAIVSIVASCIAITALQACTSAALAEDQTAPAAADSAAALPSSRGAEVFAENGCAACHNDKGVVLRDIARYAPEDLDAIFESPPAGMPVFHFAEADRTALIAYLRGAY